MKAVDRMSWEELIEETVRLELKYIVERDPGRALSMELRLDALRVELDRRRQQKVGEG